MDKMTPKEKLHYLILGLLNANDQEPIPSKIHLLSELLFVCRALLPDFDDDDIRAFIKAIQNEHEHLSEKESE